MTNEIVAVNLVVVTTSTSDRQYCDINHQ